MFTQFWTCSVLSACDIDSSFLGYPIHKHEGKRPLQLPRHRRIIKMDVKETKCGSQGVEEWHMFIW